MAKSADRGMPLLVGRAPRAVHREARAVAKLLNLKKTVLVRVAVEHFCRAFRAGEVTL